MIYEIYRLVFFIVKVLEVYYCSSKVEIDKKNFELYYLIKFIIVEKFNIIFIWFYNI